MSTKRVSVESLSPGMQVATNIYTDNDQLIVPANCVLTEPIIERIKDYGVHRIRVVIPDATTPEPVQAQVTSSPQPEPTEQISYHDRIRQTEEFKQFQNQYTNQVDSLKDSMSSIMETGEIDTNDLLQNAMGLMSQSRTTLQIFDILATLKSTDDTTYAHSINVSLLATVLGKWLDYDPQDIQLLCLAGLLHDIGKHLIPKEILNKTGKLTSEEFEMLKTHPTKGYDALIGQNLDPRICDAILLHHERCDGSGYPFGLKGNDIKDFAKIIAIADVYDAMTASRTYREPICPFEVIHNFEEEGYQKYDPHMMMVFLENVVSSYLGNDVLLSDGQIGEVILINKLSLSRPVIKTKTGEFIDLSKRRDLYIKSMV